MSDINGYVFQRRGDHLVPADIHADELFAEIKDGKSVMVTVRKVRNIKQHNLAWALAQRLSEMVDGLFDRHDAMDFLKIKSRHVKYITDPRTGEVHISPKSIAFASLDQASFTRLFNRLVWVICNDIVPGLAEQSLRDEVLDMVEGRRAWTTKRQAA